MQITVTVNGTSYTRDVEARLLLIHFIRDELRLTGSHWGCDTSNCGACVMWLDGTPVKSCTVLAAMADGRRVRTVEDLARGEVLDPVQQGFAQCHGLQCGFCTPGMMMTARWLLDHHPRPSPAQVREALAGQLCRCTGYENIVRAVLWAAAVSRGEDPPELPARRFAPGAAGLRGLQGSGPGAAAAGEGGAPAFPASPSPAPAGDGQAAGRGVGKES